MSWRAPWLRERLLLLSLALWDLVGKRAGLPLCEVWGGRLREEAEFTACMGLKEPSESAATAREYRERWGFYSIKTKAGDDAALDLAIAAAVQQEIGDLEKELTEIGKKVEEYRQRERRRKPTKFKLEE